MNPIIQTSMIISLHDLKRMYRTCLAWFKKNVSHLPLSCAKSKNNQSKPLHNKKHMAKLNFFIRRFASWDLFRLMLLFFFTRRFGQLTKRNAVVQNNSLHSYTSGEFKKRLQTIKHVFDLRDPSQL